MIRRLIHAFMMRRAYVRMRDLIALWRGPNDISVKMWARLSRDQRFNAFRATVDDVERSMDLTKHPRTRAAIEEIHNDPIYKGDFRP